jgi:pimeloyl-ACP methyl ester carboxylesterase
LRVWPTRIHNRSKLSVSVPIHMSRHSKAIAVLNDGFRIAYQQWQGSVAGDVGKRCLCLHGWMDNSNSFSMLGPYLAERGYTVVAIDHHGHGHSNHNPNSQLIQFSKYAYHVKEVLKSLEWDTATLVGHRYVR